MMSAVILAYHLDNARVGAPPLKGIEDPKHLDCNLLLSSSSLDGAVLCSELVVHAWGTNVD